MSQPDTTGAGMYRAPKWNCWTGSQGASGRQWNSRQPTMEQARTEAAEIFSVPVSDVNVTAWAQSTPMNEDEWINPLT